MPDIQNVFRRGAAYWWRRSPGWRTEGVAPATLSFSLWTKDVYIARHRLASMTAQSEAIRMSIYERIARDGLRPDQVAAVMRAETRETIANCSRTKRLSGKLTRSRP